MSVPKRIMDAAKQYSLDVVSDIPDRYEFSRNDIRQAVLDSFLAGALEMDRIYQIEILPQIQVKNP